MASIHGEEVVLDKPLHDASLRRPVRWPFRLLATLVVLAGCAALAGSALAWWSHAASAVRWRAVIALPGVVALIRMAWTCAVHGRPPSNDSWPFASRGIFLAYLVLLVAITYA